MLKTLAAAAGAVLIASPASAAVVLATFQGFATGTAAQGVFGSDTAFQNAAFRVVFTIDDTLGVLTNGPTQSILQGSGDEVPITAAFIEIAGARHDFTPTLGFLQAQHGAPKVTYIASKQGQGSTNLTLRSNLSAPLGGFSSPTSSLLGGVGGAFTSVSATFQPLASLSLRTTSFVVEPAAAPPPPAPVPEPGAWALLILGFGGAGAVLRRRRSIAAA